jgi:adenosylmethionine-8-amino-7-oxononanoate aminotransferase
MDSDAARQLDRRYVWHPFTRMDQWMADEPLVVERAEGCWLIDREGRRYLDGIASLWVIVHGHRRPELDAALKAQVDKVAHATFLGLANEPAAELAARLVQLAPAGLERVRPRTERGHESSPTAQRTTVAAPMTTNRIPTRTSGPTHQSSPLPSGSS